MTFPANCSLYHIRIAMKVKHLSQKKFLKADREARFAELRLFIAAFRSATQAATPNRKQDGIAITPG